MMTLLSRAKINWFLRVMHQRPDGYHEIETIFQEIELADVMRFQPLVEPCCKIEGLPFFVPDHQNTIWRAWQAMRRRFAPKVKGLRVSVEKNIPACGGLGGGSSNAATTLRALVELFELELSLDELELIAADLGSDTAFFLRGGCAIGRGRGEQLEPLAGVPPYGLVLAFPSAQVPTAEAYAQLSRTVRCEPQVSLDELVAILRRGDVEALATAIHNDFELIVRDREWFRQACRTLKDLGCRRTFLSGSGSTVVGLKKRLEDNIFAPANKHHETSCRVLETMTTPGRDLVRP